MRTIDTLALAAVVALALSCSKDKDKDETQGGVETPRAAGEKGAGEKGDTGVKVHVVLNGGPDAGTYEVTPRGSTCIDYQTTGLNGLGIAYYADPGTKGVASIDFGTKEKVPTAAPTDRFGFTIGIGKEGEIAAQTYPVRPENGRGTGTATVTGTGPRYVVKVSGKTADGVGVEATLECLM